MWTHWKVFEENTTFRIEVHFNLTNNQVIIRTVEITIWTIVLLSILTFRGEIIAQPLFDVQPQLYPFQTRIPWTCINWSIVHSFIFKKFSSEPAARGSLVNCSDVICHFQSQILSQYALAPPHYKLNNFWEKKIEFKLQIVWSMKSSLPDWVRAMPLHSPSFIWRCHFVFVFQESLNKSLVKP